MAGTLEAHTGATQRSIEEVEQCRFRWEERCFGAKRFRRDVPQGGVIIEDIDAAAKGADHQVVHLRLDSDVAHGDGWKATAHLLPALPAIDTNEHPVFGPHKEQGGLYVILADRVDRTACRKIAGDGAPRTATITGAKHVRLEITALVVVEAGVHHVGVVRGGGQVRHVARVRHAGEPLVTAPGSAAVLAHMHESVIGADVKQAFDQRRLSECDDIAVVRC